MKVALLAGGLGTRLAEETSLKPKPMVEIGGRPILWHIMKHFSHFRFHEHIVAPGDQGDVSRRHFLDYATLGSNISIDLSTGRRRLENHPPAEPWQVHLVETGDTSN